MHYMKMQRFIRIVSHLSVCIWDVAHQRIIHDKMGYKPCPQCLLYNAISKRDRKRTQSTVQVLLLVIHSCFSTNQQFCANNITGAKSFIHTNIYFNYNCTCTWKRKICHSDETPATDRTGRCQTTGTHLARMISEPHVQKDMRWDP